MTRRTEVRVTAVRDRGLTLRWEVRCVIPCRCGFRGFWRTQGEAMDAARHRTARPAHVRWREQQQQTTTQNIDMKGAAA